LLIEIGNQFRTGGNQSKAFKNVTTDFNVFNSNVDQEAGEFNLALFCLHFVSARRKRERANFLIFYYSKWSQTRILINSTMTKRKLSVKEKFQMKKILRNEAALIIIVSGFKKRIPTFDGLLDLFYKNKELDEK